MTWTAHYFDRRLNRDGVSRAFAFKEGALRQARDLMRRDCGVRFVQGPNGEKIDAVTIAAWCKKSPNTQGSSTSDVARSGGRSPAPKGRKKFDRCRVGDHNNPSRL
jgi:hypothetical protein